MSLKYDLSEFGNNSTYIHFSATDGERTVNLITNRYGEGRWVEAHNGNFVQVDGTDQFKMDITSKSDIRKHLRKLFKEEVKYD